MVCQEQKKLIVILGPTASGKSELAVKLAKKLAPHRNEVSGAGFNGAEIISADSRQVYKGLDIGTGKITKKEMKGIPHYLLNVVSPKRRFTVVQYRKLALEAIEKILKNGHVPILCGGTGFYIQVVVDGIIIPEVPPNWKLRRKLEKKSVKELYKILKKLDPRRAKTIEKENPRRLIRTIEIVLKTKKPVPPLKFNPLPYPVLMFGIKKEKKELSSLINKRFLKWLKKGLVSEVKKLRKLGISWKKIEEFGIHYRVIVQYLQKKINYKKMVEDSLKEIQNYAKRQMTWFKKDSRIHWLRKYKEAEKLVKEFLEKINEGGY
jgi:tRNA dimethylallyltransferase